MLKEPTYAKAYRVEPGIRASLEGCVKSIGIKSYERNSSPFGTSVPSFFLSVRGEGVWSACSFLYPLHPEACLAQHS